MPTRVKWIGNNFCFKFKMIKRSFLRSTQDRNSRIVGARTTKDVLDLPLEAVQDAFSQSPFWSSCGY